MTIRISPVRCWCALMAMMALATTLVLAAGGAGAKPKNASAKPTGKCTAHMQAALDKTLRWVKAHDGKLPDPEQWAKQVGLSDKATQCPDGDGRYMMIPGQAGMTLAQWKAQDHKLPNGKIALLIEAKADKSGPSLTHGKDTVMIGYADGTVGTFVFTQEREKAEDSQCIANMRQLALTVLMLADDAHGKFPTAKQYRDTLAKAPRVQICPRCGTTDSYAYNAAVIGKAKSTMKNPEKTVLFYEAKQGKPDFRHHGKMCVAFADGHVATVTPADFAKYGVK